MRNRTIAATAIAVTFFICTAYAILTLSEDALRRSKDFMISGNSSTAQSAAGKFSYPNVTTDNQGTVRPALSLLAAYGGPTTAYGVELPTSATGFSTPATLADPRIASVDGRSINPSSMKRAESRSALLINTAVSAAKGEGVTPAPTGAAPKRGTERMASDFSVMSALFHFNSDQGTFRYALDPEGNAAGKATVYWDADHFDALFTAIGLAPCEGSSRYVLWYVMNDGSLTWELAFRAVSGAHQSFFLKDAPTKGVKGALLTLEYPANGETPGKTVRVLSASRIVNFQPSTAAAEQAVSNDDVAGN